MKNYGVGTCKLCGCILIKRATNHVLCGSKELKTGCAYKEKLQRSENYRLENKDKIWQSYLKYKKIRKPYNKNRQRNIDYIRKFGITLTDYNLMLEKQGGVCKICKKPEKIKANVLSVDHCHKTGKVRGLLCNMCNRGLGFLQDDIEIINSALNYLKKSL